VNDSGQLEQMQCRDLVELVTEYMEGALPAADRVGFEAHLASCPGCLAYLHQMRITIRVVAKLRERGA
jgi:anti-sigma factor RsiW